VQVRHDQFERGDVVFGMDVDRDATAIVLDRAGAIVMDAYRDLRAIPGESLVDRVVDDLEDTVMETALVGIADIHIGALADAFEAFQFLDF
jgi:hypothetical protein